MRRLIRSFFRLLKKDSATALSQQFPRRLILGSRWLSLHQRLNSSLPNWLPWSEWIIPVLWGACATPPSWAHPALFPWPLWISLTSQLPRV